MITAGQWKDAVFETFRCGPTTEAELCKIIKCRPGQAVSRLRFLGWKVIDVGKIPIAKGRPRKIYALEGI